MGDHHGSVPGVQQRGREHRRPRQPPRYQRLLRRGDGQQASAQQLRPGPHRGLRYRPELRQHAGWPHAPLQSVSFRPGLPVRHGTGPGSRPPGFGSRRAGHCTTDRIRLGRPGRDPRTRPGVAAGPGSGNVIAAGHAAQHGQAVRRGQPAGARAFGETHAHGRTPASPHAGPTPVPATRTVSPQTVPPYASTSQSRPPDAAASQAARLRGRRSPGGSRWAGQHPNRSAPQLLRRWPARAGPRRCPRRWPRRPGSPRAPPHPPRPVLDQPPAAHPAAGGRRRRPVPVRPPVVCPIPSPHHRPPRRPRRRPRHHPPHRQGRMEPRSPAFRRGRPARDRRQLTRRPG